MRRGYNADAKKGSSRWVEEAGGSFELVNLYIVMLLYLIGASRGSVPRFISFNCYMSSLLEEFMPRLMDGPPRLLHSLFSFVIRSSY
jgi:hypothetical protein